MAGPWWKQSPYLSNLYGIGEAAATIGGGMLTQSGAGLAGLAGWLAGASPEERARIIEEAMQQSPYLMDPGSAEGQQIVQGMGYLMSPVQRAGDWLATASEQAGGGPLAMSIAKTLPDAALWGLGTPSMLRGGAAVSRGAEALTGRVADLAATGPGAYRAQSGARPVYSPAQAPPALLPGGEVQPIPEPGPVSPLKRWGAQAGALHPDAPNPFYENLGTAIRNRPGAEPLPPEGSQRPFYSVLYDAVDKLPNKGTPQEMVSILKKNGVKQAEIDAFLLPELFSGQWSYDPEARYFTEQDIVEDPEWAVQMTNGPLAPKGGAPKFVTKQQIKDFISPSTETKQGGPASVFDVQQWRRGTPDSGIQKLLSQDEQAKLEQLARTAMGDQKFVSDAAQSLSPEIDGIRSKYPGSFFKNTYDISSISSDNGRYPFQQIGMNGFGFAFSKEYPDTPLSDADDIGVIEGAFRKLFKEINDGEDFSRLTYADWVTAAEDLGFDEVSIRMAEEWFDSLPDERKNFVAAYFDAGVEAEDKLGKPLQQIIDANDKFRVSIKEINRIQNPEHSAPAYGMLQLLEGPEVDQSIRPGSLEVGQTSLETGLLVPSEWSNTIPPESYHRFPAGTVVFNRTTQRPLHLRNDDPSVFSPKVARLAEQVQSDINQHATRKYTTDVFTPEGERVKVPVGYLMGRVPKLFMSQRHVFPQERGMVNSSSAYMEPNTQPLALTDSPVRLPFSDTGQWSRLGIAQVFADAIEAGDDVVSISSPTQHMLAHQGQYMGSMSKDQDVLYIPNFRNYSQNQMKLENFEDSAPKELKEGAKEWNLNSLTGHIYDFVIQNTLKEKAATPLWLKEEIDRTNKKIEEEEAIPAFGEAATRQEKALARFKNDLSSLEKMKDTFNKYSANQKLLDALGVSFLRGTTKIDDAARMLAIDPAYSSYYSTSPNVFSGDDFNQTAADLAQEVALQISRNNGIDIKKEDVHKLKLLGIGSNLISLKAGNLYPRKNSSAAGLSTFYGKNLKSTLDKFAKEIDPSASVEIGVIPSETRESGNQILFDQDVYTVKITDRMREQYRNKGFKLFTPAIAGGYLMEQTLRAEIEKRRKAMLED
jgi:hypothetical protein